jgi:hypothetical protein
MWRTLIAATLVYGCGHPGLEDYRPAMLDTTLQAFHQNVNAAARDGQKALATLDDARCMRYLKGYIASMDAQLRSAR